MSGGSSSAAGWFTLLEPVAQPTDSPRRPDDPRLGEVVEFWKGDREALRPGRAVILGFPQDEGVRRNGGRVGAAEAPGEIRRWLYRLTPWHPRWGPCKEVDLSIQPPLDAGNVRIAGTLEETQENLGTVVGELLKAGTVPVVLGGGHETAYGHYLGYVGSGIKVSVVNVDAHLDVRPLIDGKGHSGSPFRQMLEHPREPLRWYSCVGVRPGYVSRAHWEYAVNKGCRIEQSEDRGADPGGSPGQSLHGAFSRLVGPLRPKVGEPVFVTMDADAFSAADVPGVSAPNAGGLPGLLGLELARAAGWHPRVQSFELVEINPRLDRDDLSARWAALVVWHFLVGLGLRRQLESAA